MLTLGYSCGDTVAYGLVDSHCSVLFSTIDDGRLGSCSFLPCFCPCRGCIPCAPVIAFGECEPEYVVPTHGGKSKMLVKKDLLLILIDVQIRCVYVWFIELLYSHTLI
jgi:hypothetical protein